VEDELLGSPMVRHPELRREVAQWVEFWEGAGARWFPEYLERMAWFEDAVDSMLVRRGLPLSLRYLPIIESGYSPRAVSRAHAVGLWQFMSGTARGLGLSVDPLLDERRDPFKSTDAAGAFLRELKDRFGSWFLALAAYNAGPNRVQRVLNEHAPLAPRSDSLYWQIREHLPRETRDFLPKFLGAATVASNPRSHGFLIPEDSLGFEFDHVTVPDATTLDVVAEAAGVGQDEIQRLNPQVVRGITPPGRETRLRVPAGSGAGFTERYALIPPTERVTFVEHRVVSGETFTHIARRYGVPLSELRAANPGVVPRRLQIGQRVTVPVAPSARAR
jgi:membrane-bound lytic murein transglycosylase D